MKVSSFPYSNNVAIFGYNEAGKKRPFSDDDAYKWYKYYYPGDPDEAMVYKRYLYNIRDLFDAEGNRIDEKSFSAEVMHASFIKEVGRPAANDALAFNQFTSRDRVDEFGEPKPLDDEELLFWWKHIYPIDFPCSIKYKHHLYLRRADIGEHKQQFTKYEYTWRDRFNYRLWLFSCFLAYHQLRIYYEWRETHSLTELWEPWNYPDPLHRYSFILCITCGLISLIMQRTMKNTTRTQESMFESVRKEKLKRWREKQAHQKKYGKPFYRYRYSGTYKTSNETSPKSRTL